MRFKIKNIEQVLLSDLKAEVKTSISDLQYVIDSHTENLAAATLLTEFMYNREKGRNVVRAIWAKALKDMDYNVTYDPKLGILKSIITSGVAVIIILLQFCLISSTTAFLKPACPAM